jgi:hypothetical protein
MLTPTPCYFRQQVQSPATPMLPCPYLPSTGKALESNTSLSHSGGTSISSVSISDSSESSSFEETSDGSSRQLSSCDVPQPTGASSSQGIPQQQPLVNGSLPLPSTEVKSDPASSAEGVLQGMRAELAAMRVLLQLRLPPRPPTPASPLVPAAAMDAATGTALSSAHRLPPLVSQDYSSTVALRTSILEEVRSAVRDALTTALPCPMRRSVSSGLRISVSRAPHASRKELPAPRVLSVMAHRSELAPWRGWSPSPTQSARQLLSPVNPDTPTTVDGDFSAAGDAKSPQQERPSPPPPSPIRPGCGQSHGAQSGPGEQHTGQSVCIKSRHRDGQPPPAILQPLRQEPTSKGQGAEEKLGRSESVVQMGLGRMGCGAAACSVPGAFACGTVCDHRLLLVFMDETCIAVATPRPIGAIKCSFLCGKGLALWGWGVNAGDPLDAAGRARPLRSCNPDSPLPSTTTSGAKQQQQPPTLTPSPSLPPGKIRTVARQSAPNPSPGMGAGAGQRELSAWLDKIMLRHTSGGGSDRNFFRGQNKEEEGDCGGQGWQVAHSGQEVVRVKRQDCFAPSAATTAAVAEAVWGGSSTYGFS